MKMKNIIIIIVSCCIILVIGLVYVSTWGGYTFQEAYATNIISTPDSPLADYTFDICGNYKNLAISPLEFENKVRDYIDGSNSVANLKTNYDANSDAQYHLSEEDVLEFPDGVGTYGTFINKNNKVVYVPWQNTTLYPIFYESGKLPFAPYTYVPTYEDSVVVRVNKEESKF